jgi:hypothetical protein
MFGRFGGVALFRIRQSEQEFKMIRMTKGERTKMRDQFKLRLNQALFQTNFHRVYDAHHERFDLETDKPTKTTVFKAHGVATVEGYVLQWFIEAAHTGEYENQRPVFKILNVRYGNGTMGHKQLGVGGTGDLIVIGPTILKEVFAAFRARLPKFLKDVAAEKADKEQSNKVLRFILEQAQKRCKHKPLKYISLHLSESSDRNELGKPYAAHMIFDWNGIPNSLHFKFERIGRELEFELESVFLDAMGQDSRKVPFNVSPFTAQGATLTALRNAIQLLKIETKGNNMTATTTNGTRKTAAPKKPVEKLNGNKGPIVAQVAKTIEDGKKAAAKKPAAKGKPTKAELAAKPIPKRAPRAKGQNDLALISDAILGDKRPVEARTVLKARAPAAPGAKAVPVVKAKPEKVWNAAAETELRQLLDSQRNIAARIDLLQAAQRANNSPEVQSALDAKQAAKDTAFLDQIRALAKQKKFVFKLTKDEGNDVYRLTGKLQSGKRFDLSLEFKPRNAVRFLADVFVASGTGQPTLAVEELSVEIKTFAQYANLLNRIERESAAATK